MTRPSPAAHSAPGGAQRAKGKAHAHLAVRAVLSLREEVHRHVVRVGAGVGDDEHLGGPRGHVDGHHGLAVLQEHLGGRDELVAGAEELVHLVGGPGGRSEAAALTVSTGQAQKAAREGEQATPRVIVATSIAALRAFGQESVPQAMAATAWAPPALRRCVTPALRATYSTSGQMEPSLRGGVARTTAGVGGRARARGAVSRGRREREGREGRGERGGGRVEEGARTDFTLGDPGGDREHEGGGREDGGAAGDVQADGACGRQGRRGVRAVSCG